MSRPPHLVQGPNSYHSGDVKKLSSRLGLVKPGDLITYQEMSSLIGRDVQDGSNRIALLRARQRALEEHGVYFITEINVGLRRATNEETSKSAERDFKSIRRKAGKVKKRLKTVDVLALNPDEKIMHIARASLAELLEVEMRASSVKKVGMLVSNTNGSHIPRSMILDAFRK